MLNKDTSLNFRVQDYLSLGYLYILLVWLGREAIFYSILGINILEYSSITDVLISPLAYIIETPLILAMVLLFVLVIHKQKDIRKVLNRINFLNKKDEKQGGIETDARSQWTRNVFFLALAIGSLLLGTGVGAGYKVNSLMVEGKLEMRDRVVLLSGDTLDCRIIGQNSSFIFLSEQGQKRIDILPVMNVVEKIQRGVLEE